jgi:UDP-N-acetylmuramoyl-L-alanyl-D-glutamate--2,6-diaminopimelate ligase
VLCLAGASVQSVLELAQTIKPVPGRVEFFPGEPNVVVDYAHTPDALEKVLATLRPHVHGRLICVIGCGGDRDSGKRPLMANAAEQGADLVWLTSDNPRSEDPLAIIRDMAEGLSGRGDVRQRSDRREAITEAFAEAQPDDLLLIAGKGHEDYQEISGRRLPFSDRQLARKLVISSSGPDRLSEEAV